MFGLDTDFTTRQKPHKVLLIEHDLAFAHGLAGMLEQAKDTVNSVVVAESLDQGLARLAADEFGIVLLEFFLPDGAGLLNISLLKQHSPFVPVIVVGAVDDEAIAVEAVHAGAQDYLAKGQISTRLLARSIRYTRERHEADLTLLAAEEKYRGLFDHLVEGIFQTSPDGRYLMANAALARIYGYNSPEELIHSITDIGQRLYVAPARREEFRRTMEEHDTITGFESQIFRKDGSIIWISENCRAIRDAKGRLVYYEGTVEDITLRRAAEQDLRNSESLYHSLVETMPQNVFRKDLHGKFTFANKQYCKHYNCKLEDILGKDDFDFFPKQLAEQYRRDDQRVMATGQTYEIIEEHHPLGQTKGFVQVVKTPLYGPEGTIIGLQGIFWDITAQKMAEEQVRKANQELAQSQEILRLKNLQMEEDLKMAGEIQVAMLPQQSPTFPRNASPAESTFQFTHRYHPSGTVGGDFFTVNALSDTEAAVLICDVAGHGVRSALVTAMIRALAEELRPLAHHPGRFMTKLNSDLFAILKHAGSPVLTTAFYLVADAATGQMVFSNAGHPKPLVIRRGESKVEPLKIVSRKNQPALGLYEKAEYLTSDFTLSPRDLVMLFTDGLYEITNAGQELYTQDMLTGAVRKRLGLAPAQLFDELIAEIRAYSANGQFEDDVCLVGMEFAGTPQAKVG